MADFTNNFNEACKFGRGAKDTIHLKNITKWFTVAKVYNKKLTTTDTDIAFSKTKKKELNLAEFTAFCKDVGKKLGEEDGKTIIASLTATPIQATGTTKTSKTGNVAGMTDTSQYTGSHKERFDESGKGKGAAGRADLSDNSGYVGNYKGEGTFDKKH